MELTKTHIADLYKFTREHYVEWYDLQTELVDHLAADIEGTWEENPTYSFEKARDISFKKFGVFGFSEIVEQKQNVLNKQYWKAIWKEFKTFFKIPKIILTLFFMIGTYFLFSFFNNGVFIASVFVLTMVIYPVYKTIVVYKKMKRRKEKTKKIWLVDSALFQSGFSPFIILFPQFNFINLFLKQASFTQNQLIIMSITFVLFNLLFYISTEVVRPKMQEKMGELFPEYKFVEG